jgi:hypothetical protein
LDCEGKQRVIKFMLTIDALAHGSDSRLVRFTGYGLKNSTMKTGLLGDDLKTHLNPYVNKEDVMLSGTILKDCVVPEDWIHATLRYRLSKAHVLLQEIFSLILNAYAVLL